MNILFFIASGIAAYLICSVNPALIITEIKLKEDIREIGSGNAGMTNVLRAAGKKAAALTLAGDIFKCFIAVAAARLVYFYLFKQPYAWYLDYITGYAAVAGHLFPLYYGFKGGKGVAVCACLFLLINPFAFAAAFIVFIAAVILSKMISAASVISAALYPAIHGIILYYGGSSDEKTVWRIILTAGLSLIIIIMHRGNIKRILSGTERKIK
ncbi:MAG: glycerol-3-phosphate 1-O-acyltransferase PlsY [Oscillospiraceae bacterium]|nr:glycerol-3-phosphate 1-O-acyltransferase PlsY [Oscillospiraceae bacterium]